MFTQSLTKHLESAIANAPTREYKLAVDLLYRSGSSVDGGLQSLGRDQLAALAIVTDIASESIQASLESQKPTKFYQVIAVVACEKMIGELMERENQTAQNCVDILALKYECFKATSLMGRAEFFEPREDN